MAQIYGPTGAGCINPDSFQTVTPPPPPAPGGTEVIVATDKKVGPPTPGSLGGNSKSGHGNKDSYWK